MTDRYCGFDLDQVAALQKALADVTGPASSLSADIGKAVDRVYDITKSVEGYHFHFSLSWPFWEAHSSDADDDRRGLRDVAKHAPDLAAEIGRRLAHLRGCRDLEHDGFHVDAAEAFDDEPPPDEGRIDNALVEFHKALSGSSLLDSGHLEDLVTTLSGLGSAETEAFVASLSDEDLGLLNVAVGLPQVLDLGLSDDGRTTLANALFSKACSDQVSRLANLVPSLEPTFQGMDKSGAWTWISSALYTGDGASVEDINQGQVGDCWFLAALAAEVERDPQFVQNHLHDNGNGSYTITFYQDGHPVPVTVDGRLPTDNGGSGMPYVHGDPGWGIGGAMWVALYEKAYAQLHGGYHEIEGGYGDQGMSELTGSHSDRISPALVPLDVLQQALASGHPLTAGTDSHHSGFLWLHSDEYFDDNKLVTLHEYTVVSVDPHAHTITLRNPWGSAGAAPEFVTLSEDEFTSHFTEVSIGND